MLALSEIQDDWPAPDTWEAELASKAARELRALRRAKEQTLAPFKAEIETLRERVRSITALFDIGIASYETMLAVWLEANPPAKGKFRDLPAGRIGHRKAPDTLDVLDLPSAVVWAKAHLPAAVKVDERVDKQLLKKHITRTGEAPDGVEYLPGEDRFYFKETE